MRHLFYQYFVVVGPYWHAFHIHKLTYSFLQIIPHINGINTAQRIAQLSDTSPILALQALRELLHYNAIRILDLFSFFSYMLDAKYSQTTINALSWGKFRKIRGNRWNGFH